MSRVVFALVRLLTSGLLLWALARHPIGYYTILRLLTCGVCLYAGYEAIQEKQTGWVFVFGGIALVFQPLVPLRMTRETWKYIDVFTALFMIVSIALFKRPTEPLPPSSQ